MTSSTDLPDSAAVAVRIYVQGELAHEWEWTGKETLEFGRRRDDEPPPFCTLKKEDKTRLIIADVYDRHVSRHHLKLKSLSGDRVEAHNLSGAIPVLVEAGAPIGPGETATLSLPVLFRLTQVAVRVEAAEDAENASPHQLNSLAHRTRLPGEMRSRSHPTLFAGNGSVSPLDMVRCFEAAMEVLQGAASSPDFLADAARATAQLVGLDAAAALRWDGVEWRVEALEITRSELQRDAWRPSRAILQQVLQEKKTFWRLPAAMRSESRVDVQAVVASPILDEQGRVLGALYGDRRKSAHQHLDQPVLSTLEASMVELFACGVAAGLARLRHEQAALAARVRFEQFFTPELAQRLDERPDLLDAKHADVSVLFCDIRGFSRISHALGPARTIPWLSDVMGVFSDCVLDLGGVLVDYTGDELMAMWGAPLDDEHHADKACRAAHAILGRLPELNARWQDPIGECLDVGIGINSGTALVGNTGTRRKFKYGALGTTVNLASRVQGAGKYFQTSFLITGATAERLGPPFQTQRLATVRVVNIADPVPLYEVALNPPPPWRERCKRYQTALVEFEAGRFLAAVRILGGLLEEHPDDGPTRLLLQRAVNALSEDPSTFTPVWPLPGK